MRNLLCRLGWHKWKKSAVGYRRRCIREGCSANQARTIIERRWRDV